MRTTLTIDDELYRSVKERAARSGRTDGAVLEDAIRIGLRPQKQEAARRFRVRPMTGSGGLRPGIDLSSNSSVQDALDEGLPLDALR